MKLSTKLKWFAGFILIGNSLFFWPSLMDKYQVSRFLFLSLTLLISLIFLYKNLKKSKHSGLILLDIFFLTYYGIHLVSLSWAMNFGESIFTTQKIFLSFCVYYLARVFSSHRKIDLVKVFSTMSLWLTGALCAYVTFEIVRLSLTQGYSNQTLYNVSGAMGNKSLLSEFLFLLIPLNLIGFEKGKFRNFFVAAIIYQVLLIIVLQTRTVYLTLFIIGLLYLIHILLRSESFRGVFLKRIAPIFVVFTFLFLGVLYLTGFLTSISERLNFTEWSKSDTALERRFIWYKTNELISENWVKGVGSGNWKIMFPSKGIAGGWRFEEQDVIATRVHNDYLEVLSETGIIGIISFAGLFILPLFYGIRTFSKSTPENKTILFILMLGLFSYALISIFDFPKERIEHSTIWAIYIGLITGLALQMKGLIKVYRNEFASNLIYFLMLFLLAYNMLAGGLRFKGEHYARKAVEYKMANRWDEVIKYAELANTNYYTVDATCVPIKWYSGLAKFNLNRIQEAKDDFIEAFSYNPYNFHVVNNLGTCVAKENKFQEAIPYFEEALRINPKFEDSKYNISFSLYQLGRYEEALNWVQQTTDSEKKNLFIQTIRDKMISDD